MNNAPTIPELAAAMQRRVEQQRDGFPTSKRKPLAAFWRGFIVIVWPYPGER
jgi:hypothetical protein